jgi:iduronate 2-sulfatase
MTTRHSIAFNICFMLGLVSAWTHQGLAEEPPAKNVLLICVDDLRPELASFGAAYIKSPNIDQLAATGRAFQRHFVNAPSCGPSRYTLLTGRYGPAGNGALFARAKKIKNDPDAIPPSMPEWFRQRGYTTVSVGKVSHHPGGRGGADWNDSATVEMPAAWDRHRMPTGDWQHPRGAMHGLSHGKIREKKPQTLAVFEADDGDDSIYPDGLIAATGLQELETLAHADKPFFLAIGLLKPHLPFGAPKKYLDLYDGVKLPPILHPEKPSGKTTWHGSGEFMRYNRWGKHPNSDPLFANQVRRHYAACVSYADKHVGDILKKLQETGADKNTIVVLWGDHGWHLGEHQIWGKHSLFEESLRSPLVIRYPGLTLPGKSTQAVVQTLDLFPTICDLTGVEKPKFAQGRSLLRHLQNPDSPGHAAIAYSNNATTIRTSTHRLTVHRTGQVELYDHTSDAKETENIAQQNPEIVLRLKQKLNSMRK